MQNDTKRRATSSAAKRSEERITLQIERLDDELRGTSYVGGKRYVAEGTLPGEEVRCKVEKTEGNVHVCSVEKICKRSERRITAVCPYAENCGGCALQMLPYAEQLAIKQALVQRKLAPFGVKTEEVVPTELAYRNKVHLVFGFADGKTQIGFFDSRTHKVTDIAACMLHQPWLEKLISALRAWQARYKNRVFIPYSGQGSLRFAVARSLKTEDRSGIMLTLVSTEEKLKGVDFLYAELKKSFDSVSLWQNVNAQKTNEVLAGEFRFLLGEKRLKGSLCGVRFSLSPDSFFQVNEKLAERIYQRVFAEIERVGADTVIDAYSGIGITSAMFARQGKRVISIEIEPSAVEDEKRLLRENGLSHLVEPICGDVGKTLSVLRKSGRIAGKTAFFVDPPRAGLGREAVFNIAAFGAETVIYLSCNPVTLADDLRIFEKQGYKTVTAVPYDLFGYTRHVETLCLLSKKD